MRAEKVKGGKEMKKILGFIDELIKNDSPTRMAQKRKTKVKEELSRKTVRIESPEDLEIILNNPNLLSDMDYPFLSHISPSIV